VPASGNLAVETFNVGVNDFVSVLTLYSGTPGSLFQIACNDGRGTSNLSKVIVSGQTPGDTLYIRVWRGSYAGEYPFEICARDPVIPANDLPTTATALAVGSGSCGTPTQGTTIDATDSGVGAPASCGDGYATDVWYKVVVPASGNLAVETFNVGNHFLDTVLAIYSGTSPGNLSQIACNNDRGTSSLSKVVVSGQTPGATLYIRVWGYYGDVSPFEICAWDPATPANNLPADATALAVASGSCGTTTQGTTVDATDSGVEAPTTCGSGYTTDVWYKATVPASGNFVVETFNVSNHYFDSVLTVYSGTPGSLSQIACNDNINIVNSLSKVVVSGQTPGATLYVRVWGKDGDSDPFSICAWDPQPLSTKQVVLESFRVYPNPTINTLQLSSPTAIEAVEVFALSGKRILQPQLQEKKAKELTLDVSSLPSGLYIVRIQHLEGSGYAKFVKY
jgi:hypothetical protein